MPNNYVSTQGDFAEFANNIEHFKGLIPGILDDTCERVGNELLDRALAKLRGSTTSKGGTYDSDSSPYSPGGENLSTTKQGSLLDDDMWTVGRVGRGGGRVDWIVTPTPAISDRANIMEEGTVGADIFPDGDDPMYFRVYGKMVVVSTTVTEDATQSLGAVADIDDDLAGIDRRLAYPTQFDLDPIAVDGVEATWFFRDAYMEIEAENLMQSVLMEEFTKATIESDLDEYMDYTI